MRFRFDVFFKGMAMGAADVVPGVSGGTIAFISGIYETLLQSIGKINLKALQVLRKEDFAAFWAHINGNFLLPLVLGIGLSIRSLASLIKFLLKTYPELLWAFFMGLILASVVLIGRQVPRWKADTVLFLVAGTAVAYWITVISPAQGPEGLWFVFVAGMIAICAMILPGISGSFILLLMGMYSTIIGAISNLQLGVLAVFAAGALTGLLSFSRLLSWMFAHYRAQTLALLTGFMLGSLNKVWPWKVTLEFRTNRHGEEVPFIQENVLPWNYTEATGQPDYLWGALLLLLLGILLVWLLEYWGAVPGKKSEGASD